MHYISKGKAIAIRSLKRRALLLFLIAGLMLAPAAGTYCAATRARSSIPNPETRDLPLATQDPSEGLRLIMEGQALMARQTREGIDAAIAKYKEAFAAFQKINFKEGMSAACLYEGIGYDMLGRKREALNAFLDARRYMEESWIRFISPTLQAIIGAAYAGLGELDKAIELLNEAIPKIQFIPEFHAYGLKGLGEVYVRKGQKQKALKYLLESRKLYKQTGNWRNEIQVLVLISALKSSLGESKEAHEFAREAVERAKEKNSPDSEAYGHLAFAAAYFAEGKLEQAATKYKQTAESLRKQGDKSGEAMALNNLGLIYNARGELDDALEYYKRAMVLYEQTGETEFLAYALSNIGTIYTRRGEPIEAFRYLERALNFAKQHKDRRLQATVISSIANYYFLFDNPNHSLRLFKESAATLAEVEEPSHSVEMLINIADGYVVQERYKEAFDTLRPVLESKFIEKDPMRHGYALREMAYIYSLMNDREKARKYYAEALSRLKAAGDGIGVIDLYAALGSVYTSEGNYQKAEEYLTESLTRAREARLPQIKWMTLALLGSLKEKQGNLAQAESFYDEQIAAIEAMRSSAHIEELKIELDSTSAKLFSAPIFFKLKLGKESEAFDLTERVRARTFLDQMNNVRIDIGKGANPYLSNQEQSLRIELRSLEEKLREEQRNNPSSPAIKLLEALRNEKEEAYAALIIRLKASDPQYEKVLSYPPVALSRIQQLLGPQTTMVSYFVTSGKTLAFVVNSDSLQVIDIPVKEEQLRNEINWFREFANLKDTEHQSLKQLHTWLIAPIRNYIKTRNLVIVPHGVLHYLPFAGLTDGHRYFGEDHTIYYLPSASTLPLLRGRHRRGVKRVLAVAQANAPGLTSLSYVDKEAIRVAELYNSQPLLTGRATRAEILKRVSAYDGLHIAAHAELKANSPLFSRILLSSDKDDSGAIEVREIYGMKLNRANLVVLSACDTQLGAHSKGDDIVGLNRAFIYAGASSVIASLWAVDDEATSFLMRSFYTHLKRGMGKAAALQAAQTATRMKYPHPYYWAAFILTGDPRQE
jgi:CHAT domain-containing protein/Tfp pilus assembly protein PilF